LGVSLSHRLWCTNQTEYFDLQKDPYELDNQAGVKGEHEQGEFSEMKRLLVRAEQNAPIFARRFLTPVLMAEMQ
jgi:hypothetical protein